MYTKKSLLVIFSILCLSACGVGNEKGLDMQVATDAAEAAPQTEEQIPVSVADSTGSPEAPISPVNNRDKKSGPPLPVMIDWDKKIIKTAQIELSLKDYSGFNRSLSSLIKQSGGYIAEEQMEQTDYRTGSNFVIKIPTANFTDFINGLQNDGVSIVSKNIRSEDVTAQYIDTKARIQAKREVRDRYLALLRQSGKMEDVLQVQSEINEIQESIESATAQINHLQHASAYSTVNLSCYQYNNGYKGNKANIAFGEKLVKAFQTGTNVLANILLFVITLWPFALAGIAVLFWIRYLQRNKKSVVVK